MCPNTHARPTSKSSVNQRGRCTDEELSLLPDKLPMSAIIISDFPMYVEQYISLVDCMLLIVYFKVEKI